MVQILLQQSPFIWFPSSHYSLCVILLSPQIASHTSSNPTILYKLEHGIQNNPFGLRTVFLGHISTHFVYWVFGYVFTGHYVKH